MAGKNQVTLTFAGDADSLDKAAAKAAKATESVGDAAAKAGADAKKSGKETEDYAGHMAKLSIVTMGVSDAIGQAGGLVADLSDFQNRGKERAAAYARTQLDIQQAGIDAKQAIRDLSQATLDLRQAQIDSTQAAADVDQALIDQKQAALDVTTAQAALKDAIAQHGKTSAEARQATIDLSQAQQDLKQAGIDVTQAQLDQSQASEDGKQAMQDQAQAALDSKSAIQDQADAQREAASQQQGWRSDMEDAISVAANLAGTIGLVTMATDALKWSTIQQTAAAVASKAATIAGAAAAGIATAAQWAWDIAVAAFPIVAIIAAIALLVGGIIYLATKTQFFQTIWRWTWGQVVGYFNATKNAIVTAANGIVSFFTGLGSRIARVTRGMWDGIKSAFRSAINWIIGAWNSLRFTVPSFDFLGMHVGGVAIGVPPIQKFHTGGVVPGAPGSESLAILQAGERVTPAGQGGAQQVGVVFQFSGSTDTAFASAFTKLVETGQIKISATAIV